MASVFDVAVYILSASGEMPAIKLHKLLYYSQAWSLVWDGKPLFPEEIQAWVNGPVVPAVYNVHKGMFKLTPGAFPQGKPDALTEIEKESVDVVLDYYGEKSSQYLMNLVCSERPWKEARNGLPLGERGNRVIHKKALADFYGSI